MNTSTMTMNAVSCVAFARLRPANVLLAAIRVQDQGITVSLAGSPVLRRAGAGAPFSGFGTVIAVDAVHTTYKTPDVARSRLGRPPV